MQNQNLENPLDLSKISNQEVLFRLERLSRTERKITHLVLWHINEVEIRKLYLELGYDSVYQYLTKHLAYAENAAYDRLQAARVLKKNPAIASKIEEGSLKLSQLVKVEQSLKQEQKAGKALSPENTQELLSKLENKSLFETEKILACELNQTPKTQQKIKPQKDESVRLEITLSQEQYELLKKAQSLISHSVSENNLAEVISYLAQAYIKKIEGPHKASNKNNKPEPQNLKAAPNLTQVFTEKPLKPMLPLQTYKTVRGKRKYISLKIRREVFQKAQHCCQYFNPLTGKRCASRYQLQLDHIEPLACGGTDEISNLRVLCGVCNRLEAQKWGLERSF
jgi:hypothetical protein